MTERSRDDRDAHIPSFQRMVKERKVRHQSLLTVLDILTVLQEELTLATSGARARWTQSIECIARPYPAFLGTLLLIVCLPESILDDHTI